MVECFLIHKQAADAKELENRIKELRKGFGDVAANIFLRELRGVWKKADSNPTSLVILAASELKILKKCYSTWGVETIESVLGKETNC
ncbi:hypothetical protein KEJ15_06890 [Candidatus Bathyarchaeota archaeon]|nr:hypothetical protein [Candidatus Bathyarchaeota archaeon]